MRASGTATVAVSLAGLLLAGCGADDEAPREDGLGEPPTDEPTEPDPGDEDDDVDTGDLEALARRAAEDAAERRDVDVGEVEVVRADEVTWSDGAIGCPEEDQMYTQALVEGYLVVVEVSGERMHYHGADGEPPGYCPDPQPPSGE